MMSLPYEHPRWHRVMGEALHPGGEALSRRLIRLCNFPPKAKVLDAGCGAGATVGLLIEEGFDAVGLDKSYDLLSKAKQKGPAVHGDLRDMPFEDGSFDGAICECVLSQQKKLSPALSELARVLKNGGILGVTDIFSLNRSYDSQGWDGSCASGARSALELHEAFTNHGFEVFFFEAYPRLLRECTAQLVWAGIIEAPIKICCSLSYGLWLCRKLGDEGSLKERYEIEGAEKAAG